VNRFGATRRSGRLGYGRDLVQGHLDVSSWVGFLRCAFSFGRCLFVGDNCGKSSNISENVGLKEKSRAIIEDESPDDEPVGQRWSKVEPALWKRKAFSVE